MQVNVNGEPREIALGTSLSALLTELRIDTQQVAVEVNALVVRKANHEQTQLQAGDEIEIVTFVGGG